MTFLEFHWLKESYLLQLEQSQRPQALLVWRIFNYLRGENDLPTSYDEIRRLLGYLSGPPTVAPAPPTVEDLKQKLDTVHLLHQALYGKNGVNEEGA